MAVAASASRPTRPVNYFRAPRDEKLLTELVVRAITSESVNCSAIERVARVQKIGAGRAIAISWQNGRCSENCQEEIIADPFG